MTHRLLGPAAAVLLAVLGAGLCLLTAGQVWVRASAQDPVLGVVRVAVPGRTAAPLVPAVALVALAGAVALLLGRAIGRRLVGVILALAGAVASLAVIAVLRDPASAALAPLTAATGTAGTGRAALGAATASGTGWSVPALVGAALIFAGGGAAVLRARAWGQPSNRYETTAPAPPADPARPAADPHAAWDALSRGLDPTSGPDLPE
jgi:uncharacterized membrane protein (TIGR02234 family)